MVTETAQLNKALAREFLERGFNHGDLTVVDEQVAVGAVDHQEPVGTDFATHLKAVIVGLRTAFPDLHFAVHDILAEGDIVAFRSTMTGTHRGPLSVGPARELPATGRTVSVPHMHFVRMISGKATDLWHLWDTSQMLGQLGIMPAPR
jgi:predicted ester cyclase